jgi:hypothetical protein
MKPHELSDEEYLKQEHQRFSKGLNPMIIFGLCALFVIACVIAYYWFRYHWFNWYPIPAAIMTIVIVAYCSLIKFCIWVMYFADKKKQPTNHLS